MITTYHMKPLISIVVPIYKVEQYLNRCVDSIINQSYKNLEIILVNDGSPDRCADICEEYKARDDRIIVIHKENGGLSDARNFGIERATGEFISFLDSDDWLHEDFVNRLYLLLIDKEADISVSNFLKVYDHAIRMPEIETEYPIQEFTNIESLAQYGDELGAQMVVAWGKLYRRDLFKEVRFPRGKVHEDEFTTYKLLYSARKISYTHEPLIYYFQRNDSIMGQGFDIRKKLDFMEALYGRANFLNQKGLSALSDKLYRQYFLSIVANHHHLRKHHDLQRVAELESRTDNLLRNLRSGGHTNKFRLFVELYYIAPIPFLFFYQQFQKYQNMRRRSAS